MYFLSNKNLGLQCVDAVFDGVKVLPWLNDESITHFMVYGQRPQTLADLTDWLSKDHNGDNDVFLMHDVAAFQAIGLCGLYSISLTSSSAELRILIGEKSELNK